MYLNGTFYWKIHINALNFPKNIVKQTYKQQLFNIKLLNIHMRLPESTDLLETLAKMCKNP